MTKEVKQISKEQELILVPLTREEWELAKEHPDGEKYLFNVILDKIEGNEGLKREEIEYIEEYLIYEDGMCEITKSRKIKDKLKRWIE
jgi:hypothetical protein